MMLRKIVYLNDAVNGASKVTVWNGVFLLKKKRMMIVDVPCVFMMKKKKMMIVDVPCGISSLLVSLWLLFESS